MPSGGSVIKGYLDQAIVWRDTNGDGVLSYTDTNQNGLFDRAEYYIDANQNNRFDSGETYTDANNDGVWSAGDIITDQYVYTDSSGNYTGLTGVGAVHVMGGVDRYGTGLVYNGVLLAPESAQVVTSLTTLIEGIRQGSNLTLDESVAAAKTLLGLSASVSAADLLSLDPVNQAYESGSNADKVKYLEIYAKSAQVANLLVVGGAAIQVANASAGMTSADASMAMLRALSETYADSRAAGTVAEVRLDNASFISTVFDNVQSEQPIYNVADVSTALSNVNGVVVQTVNELKQNVSALNSKSALNTLVATEYASQYSMTSDVASNTLDPTLYTDQQLANKLADISGVVGTLSIPVPGGRSQPTQPTLVTVSGSPAVATPLNVINQAKLATDFTYSLKQDLNKDVVAGDVLHVMVNGIDSGISHVVTAAEVTAGKLTLDGLSSSIWGLTANAKVDNKLFGITTRFDTATGKEGAESYRFPVRVDTAASSPTVVWQNDTGVAADGITSDGLYVNIMGAEIGADVHVEVTKDGEYVLTRDLTNTGGSPIQLAASTLGISGDGEYGFRLSQTDAAGNVSVLTPMTTPLTLTLDTLSPELAFQAGTRSIKEGAAVVSMAEQSAASLQFRATEAMKNSMTVQLSKGSTTYANLLSYSLDAGKTTFTLAGNLSSLDRGSYSLKVTTTDLAGNTVETTQSLFLEKVSFLSTFPSYINAANVASGWTIEGSTSGVEAGRSVNLSLTATGMTAINKSVAVANDGSFSAVYSASELAALAEKGYTLSYSVSDTAGHSVSGTQAVVLDKTAPTVTLELHGPDGVVATSIDQSMLTDGFSFVGQVQGLESGKAVTITFSRSGAADITLTGTVNNGAFQIPADGATLSKLSTGLYDITARVQDSALNASTATLSQVPAALGSARMTLGALADNQFSAAEVTQGFSQALSVSDPTAQVTVRLLNGNGTPVEGTTLIYVNNVLSGNLSALAEGQYRIELKVFAESDTNKTVSLQTLNQLLVIDKTAPSGFTLTPTNAVLNATTIQDGLLLTGTVAGVEAGQFVDLFTSQNVKLGSTPVDVNGAFALSVSRQVLSSVLNGDGSYALTAKVQDAAGNAPTNAPLAVSLLIDTAVPTKPANFILTEDLGISSSDGITRTSTNGLKMSAKASAADAGVVVQLLDGGVAISGVTTTITAKGEIVFNNVKLPGGLHNLSLVAVDVAGNASSASSSLQVMVDDVAPTVSRVEVPGAAVYDRGQVLNFVVQFSEPVYLDAANGAPRLSLALDSPTPRYATYQSGSGTNKFVFTYTVQSGDLDTNGIAFRTISNALQLNLAGSGNTTIAVTDSAGNAVNPLLNLVGNLEGVKINGTVVGSAVDGCLSNTTLF